MEHLTPVTLDEHAC